MRRYSRKASRKDSAAETTPVQRSSAVIEQTSQKQRLVGNDHSIPHRIKHYPQTELRWTTEQNWMPNSQVLLSRHSRAENAILFVHGWGGDAGATWEAFPQAISTMPEASNADVIFLDYPSVKSQVPFCAALLRRFLVDLARDPTTRVVDHSLPANAPRRSKEARYKKIIIVAHSMGAVICRRALMDLDQPPPNGLTEAELAKFKLLFFAPAHSGSMIPLLIGSGIGLDFLPGAKLLGSLALFWFQSLHDLAEGSPFLAKLAKDCQQLREQRVARRASIHHLRAAVYHAHNDRVVSQIDFDQDPPFEPVMNRNHRNICKPDDTYGKPLEALRALLSL